MICKAFIAISVTILPLIVDYFIKQRHKKKVKNLHSSKNIVNNYYYHCIFWTMENLKCREHMYNNFECGNDCSVAHLQSLINVIASAKSSISMCMYHLTLRQVTDELISARKRGVIVRIISDTVTSKMEHSKMKLLKNKFGFDVRTPPYEHSLMHHKYCVIDAKDPNLGKMFLGSLNLTLQGCVANFEFVIITNDVTMVHHYDEEFEFLWKDFHQSEQ